MAIAVAQDRRMFIDGESVEWAGGEWLEVRSPATGALAGRVPAGTPDDVDRAVVAGRRAFRAGTWSKALLSERSAVLLRLADLIEANADELAEIEVAQTGSAYKLRRDSDLPFTVDNLRFFATAVRHLEGKAAAEYSGHTDDRAAGSASSPCRPGTTRSDGDLKWLALRPLARAKPATAT
jgi:betaine-aldehyde dehydrogenase